MRNQHAAEGDVSLSLRVGLPSAEGALDRTVPGTAVLTLLCQSQPNLFRVHKVGSIQDEPPYVKVIFLIGVSYWTLLLVELLELFC